MRVLAALAALAVVALATLYALGSGWLGAHQDAGTPAGGPVPPSVLKTREAGRYLAARGAGVPEPKQILFGDLHVHTTFSVDAFMMSLPVTGGEGAYPVADACDYARHCSSLDFWSINDHALALTPRRWRETVEAMRACDAIAGDAAHPDVVPFLGWEWTQMGNRPDNHYGHKNVVLHHLDDERIPSRPIAAAAPPDAAPPAVPSSLALGLLVAVQRTRSALDFVRYLQDTANVASCPADVPVRELPLECREQAATPEELFAKLDDWGHDSLVIPHGTSWGFYTPLSSSWDKQLSPQQHDPDRQKLVEIFSGHGNSEEYRGWSDLIESPQGVLVCPEPTPEYLPTCWRAGEIVETRCRTAGESAEVCAERATRARQNAVDAGLTAQFTVPGSTVEEWLDAGQCRDCYLPAFNYRPRSSVQYMMALRRSDAQGNPLRFRFGFLASSDNHSARPGTGYKEFGRTVNTEARFGRFTNTALGRSTAREPTPESEPFDAASSQLPFFALRESERQGSFFLNGGLVAVHAPGRDRDAVWNALQRKEVYGTSGPRILLWFDLLNPPDGGERVPMGGGVSLSTAPEFEVRAVGSWSQLPGCPVHTITALPAEKIERLCRGECYNPSDIRRLITRIEIVRIRPRQADGEPIESLVEDPWKVLECSGERAGCTVRFTDESFAEASRDAVYYVRAIEEPSPAVAADPLRCENDEAGSCVSVRPCGAAPDSDDCLADNEERAWSSPIFVDHATPLAEPSGRP